LVGENDEPGDGRDLSRSPQLRWRWRRKIGGGNREPSAASLRL